MSKDKVYSTPSPNISLSNEFRGNKGSTERQDGFSIDIYPHPQKSAGTSEKSENKKVGKWKQKYKKSYKRYH